MAIAGGMTTAYTYTPQGDSGTVRIEKTTRPHSLCLKPPLLAKAGKAVRA